MTYVTVHITDTAQLGDIIAFAKRKNMKFEISDSKPENYESNIQERERL